MCGSIWHMLHDKLKIKWKQKILSDTGRRRSRRHEKTKWVSRDEKSLGTRRVTPEGINHCLWKCAQSETDRGSIVDRRNPTRVVRSQINLFGSTSLQQQNNVERHRRAHHGLVCLDNIKDVINVSPCFRHGSCDMDPTVWLQTVTVIWFFNNYNF